MHNKIINVFKKIFKLNDAENINIDELTKENYCIEKDNQEILISSKQTLTATHMQLKILEKLANGSNVQLNQKESNNYFGIS